jgi:Fe-S oxidoreductase
VNLAAHAPGLGAMAKLIGGIAPDRDLPSFAPRTFRDAWRADGGPVTGRPTARQRGQAGAPGHERNVQRTREPGHAAPDVDRSVILWVDTFTDHFHPDVARAAVRVLEDAGCVVTIPGTTLCCGRPLYDWGFLGQARHLLRNVLRELRPEIRAGVPIVGLEPSCVSVFRDEAPNLLAGDEDATRIAAQTWTLTEYLAQLDGYRPPTIRGRALVHGHCHHRSVLDFDAERRLLEATGLALDFPESGCCGMAGSFGFERGDHFRVSIAAGERALLPAVRDADPATYVVTGGFSCREQIEQTTGRRVLHPAKLLALGLDARDGVAPAGQGSR